MKEANNTVEDNIRKNSKYEFTAHTEYLTENKFPFKTQKRIVYSFEPVELPKKDE